MVQSETELYPPLKTLLQAQGFSVAGEVKNCDLVATRNDELVIVEMKRAFNLELVLQGIHRQSLAERVYLAIETPRRLRGRRWGRILKLCRLLNLGLLTVRFGSKPNVDVMLDPGPYKPRLDARNRRLLLNEVSQRSVDCNLGGSVGRPIVTAYREKALRIAWHLKQHGPARPCDLAEAAQTRKAGSIVLKNFYGWFDRIERGLYQLTPLGCQALDRYAPVVARLLPEWQQQAGQQRQLFPK
jgi:hypothetical protein